MRSDFGIPHEVGSPGILHEPVFEIHNLTPENKHPKLNYDRLKTMKGSHLVFNPTVDCHPCTNHRLQRGLQLAVQGTTKLMTMLIGQGMVDFVIKQNQLGGNPLWELL